MVFYTVDTLLKIKGSIHFLFFNLFFERRINIMVNYPTILNLPQEDINRQLYEMIVKLQKSEGADTKALEDAIDALEVRVKALEDAE